MCERDLVLAYTWQLPTSGRLYTCRYKKRPVIYGDPAPRVKKIHDRNMRLENNSRKTTHLLKRGERIIVLEQGKSVIKLSRDRENIASIS